MKAVLHVGPAKSATTFVQRSLFTNHDRLLERGVLYPKSLIGDAENKRSFHNTNNAQKLLHLLATPREQLGDPQVQRRIKRGDRPVQDLAEMRTIRISAFETELSETREKLAGQGNHPGLHTVVMATEGLFTLTGEEMACLRDYLMTLFDSISVVGHPRNQVDYVHTLTKHGITRGVNWRQPGRPLRRVRESKLDYAERIDAFDRHFGRESCLFLPFHTVKERGGDAPLRDILGQIDDPDGVRAIEDFEFQNEMQNVSMGRFGLTTLAYLNEATDGWSKPHNRKQYRVARRYLEDQEQGGPGYARVHLDDNVIAFFAESNAKMKADRPDFDLGDADSLRAEMDRLNGKANLEDTEHVIETARFVMDKILGNSDPWPESGSPKVQPRALR